MNMQCYQTLNPKALNLRKECRSDYVFVTFWGCGLARSQEQFTFSSAHTCFQDYYTGCLAAHCANHTMRACAMRRFATQKTADPVLTNTAVPERKWYYRDPNNKAFIKVPGNIQQGSTLPLQHYIPQSSKIRKLCNMFPTMLAIRL